VYTRLGDTNIPKDSSAPDDHVELMWRERFGLGLSPLQRMERLLDEPERWKKRGDEYMYYEQFPEFTIVDGETAVENFSEPWTQHFPDKSAAASKFNSDTTRLCSILSSLLRVTANDIACPCQSHSTTLKEN
jgi:hypothetical protein